MEDKFHSTTFQVIFSVSGYPTVLGNPKDQMHHATQPRQHGVWQKLGGTGYLRCIKKRSPSSHLVKYKKRF